MIRLLLMALFFYLVYTLFTFVLRSFSPKQVPPEKTSTGEEMVRERLGELVGDSDLARYIL